MTHTAPCQWWAEEPETVLTAVAVLEEIAEQTKRGRRGR